MTLLGLPTRPRTAPGAAPDAAPASGEAGTPTGGTRVLLLVCLVAGLGLLLEAWGYRAGWRGEPQVRALTFFYVGHVVLVAPFAWLLTRRLDRRSALLGSTAFGLAMLLSWFLSNPLLATRFDETLHVATLLRMVEGAGFFDPNPMLPVSPHYPGLELAASSVHWLTGLPLIACQVVVVALARTGLVLALFLVVERLTRSTRAASVAVLLYGASQQFWFFNAQFSYQTLALPLGVVLVLMTLRAVDEAARWPRRPLLVALAAGAALAVTHHLTSWLVIAALWAWATLHLYGRGARDQRAARLVAAVAAATTLLAAAWSALVGPMLADYLGPVFGSAVTEMTGLVGGADTGRELFADKSGYTTPLWERATMFGSMLLWCALLAPAAWSALRRRTLGGSPARYLPLLLAAAYPATLLARFSPTASDVGSRANSFIAAAMALVIAVWAVRHLDRVPSALVAAAGVVLVLGGTILGGGPDWSRVPGAYLPAAEQRSLDSRTVAVARWFERYAPPGSVVAADLTLSRTIPTYADVDATTSIGGRFNVTPLFTADTVDATVAGLIRRYEVDFVVADLRLAGELSRSGSLFEGSDDYGVSQVSAAQLTKFGDAEDVVTVVDQGPVRVYDVRGLRDAPRTWVDEPSAVLPGPVHVGTTVLLLELGLGLALALRRRRLPLPGLVAGGRGEAGLALVLPGLVGIGAVAVLTGPDPWVGAGVLAALGAGGIVALRRQPSAPARRLPRGAPAALVSAVAALVLAAVVVAALGAWEGLFADAPTFPPPPGVTS